MMRIFNPNNIPLTAPAIAKVDRIVLTCRFLTRLIGGGVDPKKPDLVTPVRVSAIRGQLRFWWRALSSFEGNAAKLREQESKIFGGVQGKLPVASAFSIAVTRQPPKPKAHEIFVDGKAFGEAPGISKGIAYGGFALRSTDAMKIHDVLIDYGDNTFELTIELRPNAKTELTDKELRKHIEKALTGFLHFGALGGRTRRGFGAIQLVKAEGFELPPLDKLTYPTGELCWPQLRGSSQSKRTFPSAGDAHEAGLNLLQSMRQGTGDKNSKKGRNTGQGNRPGRSWWPEADSIRAIFRTKNIHTGTRMVQFDRFPRAAFGAPIIFHFKDDRANEGREPSDVTLVPKVRGEAMSRMTSPLIIRPYQTGPQKFVALGLSLSHRKPDGWVLVERQNIRCEVKVDLTSAEAQTLTPLAGHGQKSNPVDVYLARLATL